MLGSVNHGKQIEEKHSFKQRKRKSHLVSWYYRLKLIFFFVILLLKIPLVFSVDKMYIQLRHWHTGYQWEKTQVPWMPEALSS